MSSTVASVMFVCVHNAGRSQMAQGFLQHLAGDRVEVRSSGTMPGDQVNPSAVAAMAELGTAVSTITAITAITAVTISTIAILTINRYCC